MPQILRKSRSNRRPLSHEKHENGCAAVIPPRTPHHTDVSLKERQSKKMVRAEKMYLCAVCLVCTIISVRFGSVRFGSVRFGSVRFGSVRFGSVRFGSRNQAEPDRIGTGPNGTEPNLASKSQEPAPNRTVICWKGVIRPEPIREALTRSEPNRTVEM